MGLIKEIKMSVFRVFLKELIMHCKSFEDNSGAIDIARLTKTRPRTKHTNVVFHHFREYVYKGLIHIQQVFVDEQCYDAWNKPLP